MGELEDLEIRAANLAMAGNFGSEAIEINNRLLEINERWHAAYTRLAKCYRLQGKLHAAQEMYRQVLTFQPDNRIAINGLREVDLLLADLEIFEQIAQIDSYFEALNIGVGARKRGDAKVAIAALSRAVELNRNVYSLTALAAAYRLNENYAMAKRIVREILALGDHIGAFVVLAGVHRAEGLPSRAREFLEPLMQEAPDNPFVVSCLGATYVDLGLFDRAEECFEKLEGLGFPDDESIWNLETIRQIYQASNNQTAVTRLEALLGRLRRLQSTTSR